MRIEELKPCPFCGAIPELTHIGNGFTYDQKVEIRCPKCRIKRVDAIVNGKGHTYEWLLNIAVNNWNQRWEGGEK